MQPSPETSARLNVPAERRVLGGLLNSLQGMVTENASPFIQENAERIKNLPHAVWNKFGEGKIPQSVEEFLKDFLAECKTGGNNPLAAIFDFLDKLNPSELKRIANRMADLAGKQGEEKMLTSFQADSTKA